MFFRTLHLKTEEPFSADNHPWYQRPGKEPRMARRTKKVKVLPTIWEVNDELWDIIQSILDELDPSAKTGRPRTALRAALNGIIFRMRSGCQWNHLPEEFGDDSSVHRTMQRWIRKGVIERIWAVLIENCEELGGVNWEWQSADGAMGKARFGGTLSVRTPRIAGNRARNVA
jgi:putative transposase